MDNYQGVGLVAGGHVTAAVIQRDVEDAGACCGAFSGSRYGATAVEAQAEPAESDVVYNKMVRATTDASRRRTSSRTLPARR